jgi:hypothetical protein
LRSSPRLRASAPSDLGAWNRARSTPVHHDPDSCPRHAAGLDVSGDRGGHGNHQVSGPVGPAFECLEHAERQPVAQGAHRADRVWPEVADLEDPAGPLGARYEETCETAKELRRGADDDVRLGQERSRQDRGNEIPAPRSCQSRQCSKLREAAALTSGGK